MESILNFIKKKKRGLTYLSAVLIFVFYFYLTDPDNTWRSIIITLQIIVIAFIGIIVVESLPDIILDPIYGSEKKLVDKAKEDPYAAGLILKAKSIRLLGYSIIVAASIIAFTST